MEDFKHMVVAKFKEEAAVEEILKGMEKLASEIDAVKSFEWGRDVETQETLRQEFTHVFCFNFGNKDDYLTFVSHPTHLQFSATFAAAIQKVVLLDFQPNVLPRVDLPESVVVTPPESVVGAPHEPVPVVVAPPEPEVS